MDRISEPPGRTLPRFVAVVLATAGTFWCVGLWLQVGPTALLKIPVGGEYPVTALLVVRAAATPVLRVRYLIWGLSIVFHGGCLCWAVVVMVRLAAAGEQFSAPPLFYLYLAWLGFAAVGSLVAVACERREPPARHPTAVGSDTSNRS